MQALAGVVTAVVMGASALVATAAPAQANAAQCRSYLDLFYDVTPWMGAACQVADTGDDPVRCRTLLIQVGVRYDHALRGCTLGAL